MLVAGARPNFMKVSPIYKEFKKHSELNPILVHTGQHYDYNMSDAFFQDLNLSKPDIFMGVGSGSHAEQTAKVMIGFEKICIDIKPDIVIVVGDVNSTMACSVTAKKLLIPVAHVEAGLRSGDNTMPEELNRLITDVISDFLFTPSEDANENLRREGINGDKIYFVGNIMIDSLITAILKASKKETYRSFGLSRNEYGLITLHRPSNVDSKGKLIQILNLLHDVSREIPIIFPAHPRTFKNLKSNGLLDKLDLSNNLKIIEPLSYLDFLNVMINSKFVLTDSGGIQEETTFMRIPCLTLRENTERPITITQGTNELVKPIEVKDKVFMILRGNWKQGIIPKYWDGKTAERIINVLKERL
jgi:UDP-N-acetylglucosamine 2-epimerase (non-hydrolysing)